MQSMCSVGTVRPMTLLISSVVAVLAMVALTAAAPPTYKELKEQMVRIVKQKKTTMFKADHYVQEFDGGGSLKMTFGGFKQWADNEPQSKNGYATDGVRVLDTMRDVIEPYPACQGKYTINSHEISAKTYCWDRFIDIMEKMPSGQYRSCAEVAKALKADESLCT